MSKTIENLKAKFGVEALTECEDPTIRAAVEAALLVELMEGNARKIDGEDLSDMTLGLAYEHAYEMSDACDFPAFDADPENVEEEESFEEHERAAVEALRAFGYGDDTLWGGDAKTIEEGVRHANAANFGNVGTWWQIFRVVHFG